MKLLFKYCFSFFILLFGFFTVATPSSHEAATSYCCKRAATLEDSENIMALFGQIEDDIDAKQALFIYPKQEQRKKIVEAASKGRFFIAYEQATNRPVAMLKLFELADYEERKAVMAVELGISESAEATTCSMCITSEGIIPSSVLDGSDESTTYIYVGSQYTVADFRGHGIQSQLLRFAHRHIVKKESVALLYGQIERITDEHGIVKVLSQGKLIIHLRYPTTKPAFDDEGNKVFLAENKGRGSIVYLTSEELV